MKKSDLKKFFKKPFSKLLQHIYDKYTIEQNEKVFASYFVKFPKALQNQKVYKTFYGVFMKVIVANHRFSLKTVSTKDVFDISWKKVVKRHNHEKTIGGKYEEAFITFAFLIMAEVKSDKSDYRAKDVREMFGLKI